MPRMNKERVQFSINRSLITKTGYYFVKPHVVRETGPQLRGKHLGSGSFRNASVTISQFKLDMSLLLWRGSTLLHCISMSVFSFQSLAGGFVQIKLMQGIKCNCAEAGHAYQAQVQVSIIN